MNKLILLCLVGCALLALAEARETEHEENLMEAVPQNEITRVARDAEAKKKNNKAGKRNNKRKKNNKGKKNKKGKKNIKNKQNKNRQGKKKNNKNKKNKKKAKKAKSQRSSLRQTTCTVSDDCVTNAVTYMNIVKDKVKNFEKQMKRIQRQNTTGGKKSGKKDDFMPVLTRLTNAAGGNLSAPKCGSSSNGTGVDQIKNLTSTLMNCSESVKAACDPSKLPQPDTSIMEACSTKLKAFETKVTACTTKTGAEACTCWTDSSLATMREDIKNCSLSTEASNFAKSIKSCISAFGTCRKYEDEVSSAIFACDQDPTAVKAKLKALTENTEAIKKAKSKVSSVAGSRRIRRAVPKTCAALIAASEALSTLVDQDAAAPAVKVLADEIAAAGSISCSAEEKKSLTASVSKLDGALNTLEEAKAVLQEALAGSTGSTASPDDIAQATTASSTPASTAVPSARYLL